MRFLALSFCLAIAGCYQEVELWPSEPMDAGTDAPGCSMLGAACGGSSACCSNLCRAGACALDACGTVGAVCGSALDCCSGECVSGACGPPMGCAPAGETCASASDCCSRVCAADASGRAVCQGLGGCRQAGELCSAGIECCGGSCEIFDAMVGLGRCAASGACAAVGEVCRVDGDPSADRTCCGTGAPAAGLCRPSDLLGVSRCVTETRARGECLVDGAGCAGPIDCCGGACVPSTTGPYLCASSCIPQSGDCTRDADCCGGSCNSARRCSGSSSCFPLARACATDADCCSEVCSPTRQCAPGVF